MKYQDITGAMSGNCSTVIYNKGNKGKEGGITMRHLFNTNQSF